ncbi:DUF3908 family protein [Ornithinibacillus caprae]|nr:DUF3908 family protein [Ornithinibacillus caprae]
MNYNELKDLQDHIVFENEIKKYQLQYFFETIERLGLDKSISSLYPKGLYYGDEINLILFYVDKIVIANVSNDSMSFETIKNCHISSVEMEVKRSGDGKRKLSISFDNHKEIVLIPKEDTVISFGEKFFEIIENIYKNLNNAS